MISPLPCGIAGFAGLLMVGLAACQQAEPALARGDRFWADSNYTDALAEYRLALRQHPDEETKARTAHAYIQTGQFELAREIYADLIQESPKWTDQAIFDYVAVANKARDRSDRYGLASAVAAAQELRAGLPLDDFAIPLARYYSSTGDPALALDFYERALTAAPPDTVPTLLFEMAQIHEQLGNCPEAIGFFRAFRSRAPRDERIGDADWQIGDCSFTLARRAHQDGNLERAMEYVDAVLDLGVPKNLLDEAWFERGEILLEKGQREEALLAYRMVVQLNPTGTGQMVERARRRIDDLRFGRVPGR